MNVMRIYPILHNKSSYEIMPITAMFASIRTFGAKSFLNKSLVRPDIKIIMPEVTSNRNRVSASRYHIKI